MKTALPRLVVFVTSAALVAFIGISVIAGTTGIVTGIVRDAETNAPISGANVIVVGTKLSTVTDIAGHFVITNIPPGDYQLRAEMVGYADELVDDIAITMDVTSKADIRMRKEAIKESEVVVTRPRPMVDTSITNSLTLITSQQEAMTRTDPSSVRTAPGLLSALPGVVVDPNGSGQMHLRGGRADQTGWYLEGIPITDPNTGMFGTNLFTTGINKFQCYTGSFGAEFGNAISGVLNEVKKSGADAPGFGLNSEVGSQAYKTALMEFGGGIPTRFNYYVASSLMRTDIDGPLIKDQEYADHVVKLVWPSNSDSLSLLAMQGSLVGNMEMVHTVGNYDTPVDPARDFNRQRYVVGALSWSHNFGSDSFITIRPYHQFTTVVFNAMGGSSSVPVFLDLWSARTGLQVNYTNQLNDKHLLKLGGSTLRSNNNYYIYASIPGYGIYQPYHYQADVDTSQYDIYAEDKIALGNRWTAQMGIRLESITYDRTGLAWVPGAGYTGDPVPDVTESTISPRVGITYALDDRTVWKASWGRYTKFVPANSVQKIYFDPDSAVFGGMSAEQVAPGLGSTSPQRSSAFEVSYERQISDTLALRVTPFVAKFDNLGDNFTDPLSGITTYTNLGRGKSSGVELFLRKKMSRNWQGWMSYTYQRAVSNRADLGLLDDFFYNGWDQRHTLTLVNEFTVGKWSHGIRADLGSGRADSTAPAGLQDRAKPYCILTYNLSYALPAGSPVGDSIYLSVFNLLDNRQALSYHWIGTTRTLDSWVPKRFLAIGVTRAF